MNKKKLITLLTTGILTLGIIGGTFAWFTSEDSVKNKFQTVGAENTNTIEDPENAGIEVWEKFDNENASKVEPGSTIDKMVQVKSNVTYDQFVRVKIEAKWTEVPNDQTKVGTNEGIQLSFKNVVENINDAKDGKWVKSGDYYYYIGKLPAGKFTTQLLDKVTLSGEVGNKFKNSKYEVDVIAEAVQASNDAILSVWKGTDETILNKVNSSNAVVGTNIVGAQHIKDNK